MIGGRQSPGDIIPGFDLSTGKAVGYSREQWKSLCEDFTIKQRLDYQLIIDPKTGIEQFEVFTKLDILR